MLVIIGGIAVRLTARADRLKIAVAPWSSWDATESDPMQCALSSAYLATHPPYLQCWPADTSEASLIKQLVVRCRLRPATFPPNRQMLIGRGAFPQLLQMATNATHAFI